MSSIINSNRFTPQQNNLVKSACTNLVDSQKRVIDMNEIFEQRVEEIKRRALGGFEEGISAEQYNGETVDSLPMEGEEGFFGEANDGEEVEPEPEITPEEILENARVQAEEMVEEAKKRVETMLMDATEQIEVEKQEAIRIGKEKGYDEGRAKADKEFAALKDSLEDQRKELENAYQMRFDELEPKFVETITSIYEYIFHVDLSVYGDILSYLISTALRNIEGGRVFNIHVSKEDYSRVILQKNILEESALSANADIEIVEDSNIPVHECRIETENGIFDCGVSTELTELNRMIRLLSYTK